MRPFLIQYPHPTAAPHPGVRPPSGGVEMANYLLIESRDPFEYGDARYMYDMAAGSGLERATTSPSSSSRTASSSPDRAVRGNPLNNLFQQNQPVRVLADDFSLRERGIAPTPLVGGVEVADVDYLVDLLAEEDTKALWH